MALCVDSESVWLNHIHIIETAEQKTREVTRIPSVGVESVDIRRNTDGVGR